MTPPIKIVIADDHPPFSDGLRRLLEIEPDFKVIGQANNVPDVVSCVLELQPDILLAWTSRCRRNRSRKYHLEAVWMLGGGQKDRVNDKNNFFRR